MKRSIFLLLFSVIIICAKAQESPVLIKVGDKEVSKDEFEYIFSKNNNGNVVNQKTLEEYVELFTKFRMKVNEAEVLGMDTTTAFKNEFTQYRRQITAPYLENTEGIDSLCREEYERLKQDVNFSHLLFRLSENSEPTDTLKAFTDALEAIEMLKLKKFEQVALEKSEDPSVKDNNGNIGWVTGLMTAYPLETALYTLPVGKISKPIKTDYGYHVVKVNARRNALGRIKTAHILKKFPENASEADKENVHQEILKIAEQLKADGDFAKIAAATSDDTQTAKNGGELPVFGVGRMVPEFEKAAFDLKKAGDISEPVKTQYGWHIVKLIDRLPVESYDKMKDAIRRAVENDEKRIEITKKAKVDELKTEYGYILDNKRYKEVLNFAAECSVIDNIFLQGAEKYKEPMIYIANSNYTQADFIKYVYEHSNQELENAESAVKKQLNRFESKVLLDCEEAKLEQKYPEIANLLQEYHDGILLFNIASEKVWDRASKDNEGLNKFFINNINKYKWNTPHYKGVILYCKNKKLAKEIEKNVKAMPLDSISSYLTKFNKEDLMVNSEKGLWTKGDNKTIDALAFKDKKANFTPLEDYPYTFIVGKILEHLPESPNDVKSVVIGDYQEYLEVEWVKELRSKYKVQINKDILKQIEKDLNKK
jgi:peptidyl-prolyl cis-trans isomerase SurA